MAETTDYKPYSQPLWQPPRPPSPALWQSPTTHFASTPNPLYRLRLSILRNNLGHDDCPPRVFVRSPILSRFPTISHLSSNLSKPPPSILPNILIPPKVYPTLPSLRYAIASIQAAFGGAFPTCTVQTGGVASTGPTTEEAVMCGVEDGRTESVVLRWEREDADESWGAFVGRVQELERGWEGDVGEEE